MICWLCGRIGFLYEIYKTLKRGGGPAAGCTRFCRFRTKILFLLSADLSYVEGILLLCVCLHSLKQNNQICEYSGQHCKEGRLPNIKNTKTRKGILKNRKHYKIIDTTKHLLCLSQCCGSSLFESPGSGSGSLVHKQPPVNLLFRYIILSKIQLLLNYLLFFRFNCHYKG